MGGYGLYLYGARYGSVTSPCENGNEVSGSTKRGLAKLLVTSLEEVICGINHKKNKGTRSVKLTVGICEPLDNFVEG